MKSSSKKRRQIREPEFIPFNKNLLALRLAMPRCSSEEANRQADHLREMSERAAARRALRIRPIKKD